MGQDISTFDGEPVRVWKGGEVGKERQQKGRAHFDPTIFFDSLTGPTQHVVTS
jgi:hypothetical protein